MYFSPTDLKIRLQSPGLGCRAPERGTESQLLGAEPSPSIPTPQCQGSFIFLGSCCRAQVPFPSWRDNKTAQQGTETIKATHPPWKRGSPSIHRVVTSLLPRPQAQKSQLPFPKHLDQPGIPPLMSTLQSPNVPVQVPAISLFILPPCPAPGRCAEPGLNSAHRWCQPLPPLSSPARPPSAGHRRGWSLLLAPIKTHPKLAKPEGFGLCSHPSPSPAPRRGHIPPKPASPALYLDRYKSSGIRGDPRAAPASAELCPLLWGRGDPATPGARPAGGGDRAEPPAPPGGPRAQSGDPRVCPTPGCSPAPAAARESLRVQNPAPGWIRDVPSQPGCFPAVRDRERLRSLGQPSPGRSRRSSVP